MSAAIVTTGTHRDPGAGPRTGRVYWCLGLLSVACALAIPLWFRAGVRVPGKDHWQAVARGRAFLRQGRADLAIQAVHDVRDQAPGAAEAMEVAGLALIRSGQLRLARLALERAIALRPEQWDATVALAEINFGLGNGRRGIELLQSAVRMRPREFRLWVAMGKVLHDLGDYPKSIQAYEKAVALRPDDRQAVIGLIGGLLSSDHIEEAHRLIAAALSQFPNDPAVTALAALEAVQSNQLEESIALATDALIAEPTNLNARLARARARLLANRWDQALDDAERAAAAWPNDLEALQLLLKIETRLGMANRAALTQTRRKAALERVALMNQLMEDLARRPDDPEVPWKLGQTAVEAGSFPLASQCFQAAIALDPNFRPARESLLALRRAHPELAGAAAGLNAIHAGPPAKPSTQLP